MQTGFCWQNMKERYYFEDLGINGKVLLKSDVKDIGLLGVDWIHLAQDMDK
jgi:hypothetical protein